MERMVHHRGRGDVASTAEGRPRRYLRGPIVRDRHHAADLRLVQEPEVPVVLRGNADPAHALAGSRAVAARSTEPAQRATADRLPPGERAVAERPRLPGV